MQSGKPGKGVAKRGFVCCSGGYAAKSFVPGCIMETRFFMVEPAWMPSPSQ